MVAAQGFIGPALPPDWVPPSPEARVVESYGGLTGLNTQPVSYTASAAPTVRLTKSSKLPARARCISAEVILGRLLRSCLRIEQDTGPGKRGFIHEHSRCFVTQSLQKHRVLHHVLSPVPLLLVSSILAS